MNRLEPTVTLEESGDPRDRRSEPRYPADGDVVLTIHDPFRMEIGARLLDVSRGGFRAAHMYAALSAGQVVEFQHEERSGKARVAWNRITEDRIETGFFIL